jgi:hypothetical protein
MSFKGSISKKVFSLLLVAILLYYNGISAIPYVIAETLDDNTEQNVESTTDSTEPTDDSTNDPSESTNNPNESTDNPNESTGESSQPNEQTDTFSVTAKDSINGTVKVLDSQVEKGKSTTITISADEGYYLDELKIDGNASFLDIQSTFGSVNQIEAQKRANPSTFEIENIEGNVEVTAAFAKIQSTIDVKVLLEAGENNYYSAELKNPESCLEGEGICLAPVSILYTAKAGYYFIDENNQLVSKITKTYDEQPSNPESTVKGYEIEFSAEKNSDLDVKLKDDQKSTSSLVQENGSLTLEVSLSGKDSIEKQLAGVRVTKVATDADSNNEQANVNSTSPTDETTKDTTEPESTEGSITQEIDGDSLPSESGPFEITQQKCLIEMDEIDGTTTYEIGECNANQPSNIQVELISPTKYEVTFNNITSAFTAEFFSKEITTVEAEEIHFDENFNAQFNGVFNLLTTNGYEQKGQNISIGKDGAVTIKFNQEYADKGWKFFVSGEAKDALEIKEPSTLKAFYAFNHTSIIKVTLQDKGLKVSVDNSAPEIEKINYSGKHISEHYVKSNTEVEFEIKVKNNTSDFNSDISSVVVEVNGKQYKSEKVNSKGNYIVEVPASNVEGQNTYKIIVTDKAGNKVESNQTLTSDSIAPSLSEDAKFEILEKELNKSSNGFFGKLFNRISNLVKHGKFVSDIFRLKIPAVIEEGSGINYNATKIIDAKGKELKVTYKKDDGYFLVEGVLPYEDGETGLYIILVDKVGNASEKINLNDGTTDVNEDGNFQVDLTNPTVEVLYDGTNLNGEETYFDHLPQITVNLSDEALNDDTVSGLNKLVYVLTTKDGIELNEPEVIDLSGNESDVEPVQSKVVEITLPKELENKEIVLSMVVNDRVANGTEYSQTFIVDTAAPTLSDKVDVKEFVVNNEIGAYTNQSLTIDVPAVDKLSGVKEVYVVDTNAINTSLEKEQLVENIKANQLSYPFTKKGEKYSFTLDVETFVSSLTLVMVDNLGNTSVELLTKANASLQSVAGNIVIDKVLPTIETVNSRSPEYVNNDIEYFRGNHSFSYTINDLHSRIHQYSVSLNDKNFENTLSLESATPEVKDSVTIENDQLNEELTVTISAKDHVGNATSVSKKVFVDTLTPVASNVTFTGGVTNNEQGLFTNKDLLLTFNAIDSGSGIRSIEIIDADQQSHEVKAIDDSKYEFTLSKEAYDGTLTLVMVDNVGNKYEQVLTSANTNLASETGRIVIDKVAPELSIATIGEEPVYKTGDRNFYNKDVDVTIDVKDNQAIDTTTLVFRDKEPVIYSSNGEKTETQVINTSKYKVTDNVYIYNVEAKDFAGNKTKQTYTIYVDKTEPVITKFEYAVKQGSKYENKTTDLDPEVMEKLESYVYYFKDDVQVTVTATDDVDDVQEESGLKAIAAKLVDYSNPNKPVSYEVLENGNLSVLKDGQEPRQILTSKTIKINIPKNFKGAIYATAYDHALNIGDMVSPEGTINESKEHHDNEKHIDIQKPKAPFKTGFGQELYAANVPLNVTVTDTYSGIEKIEWTITSPYDTENNSKGTVTIDNNGKMSGDTGFWKTSKTERNLLTELKGNFTVANNSNDIKVTFKITDRTGHTTTEEIIFAIDKTKPTVDVVYDLNGGDAVYEDYYMETRTATVTVTERNFSAQDVIAAITNTDGVIPAVKGWSTVVDKNNPDNNKHIATITYAADGDYTFDIDVTDLAKNVSADYTADKFTIDQTEPEINVSYSSASDAQNGMYYNSVRTATISINEHNFDASRIVINGKAEQEGAAIGFPSIGGWSTNGDVHTTTITYSEDGIYTFDIDFTDMAGNDASDYTPDSFVIDLTAPEVTITGVENETAYGDFIEPQIQYYDTNLNVDGVAISLVGANRGEVTSTVQRSQVPNGEVIVVTNLEKEPENDDIYTLDIAIRDLAGNETKDTVRYSVNRFGSTYMIVGEAEKLANNYSNQEVDVVIQEINVDTLVNEAVNATVVKDGTPKTLQKDVEYTVTRSASKANWSVYEYVMSKSLFANDGKYALNLYSKDIAGNVNDSTDPAKEFSLEFVIDKTAPLLTSLNLENKETYASDSYLGKFSVTDNFAVGEVEVFINDEEVAFEQVDDEIHVNIGRSNAARDIVVKVKDKANNGAELVMKDITVTKNLFVRYVNNKPLLYSTTGGAAAVSLATVGYFIIRRRPTVVE